MSSFSEAGRLVITQYVMQKKKLTVFSSMYYLAPVSCAWLILLATHEEIPKLYSGGKSELFTAHPLTFFAAGILAIMVNFAGFWVRFTLQEQHMPAYVFYPWCFPLQFVATGCQGDVCIAAEGIGNGQNIYAHVFKYIYIYIYKHVYIHKCVYIYIYACICIYIYIHIDVHIYIYTDIYIYIYVYTHIHTYTHMYTYIHIYIYICTGTYHPQII